MSHHSDIEKSRIGLRSMEEQSRITSEIMAMDVFSSEYADFKFLWENRDKIARNRKLIELLG